METPCAPAAKGLAQNLRRDTIARHAWVTVHAEPLRRVVRAIIEAGGSSAREAGLVADQLVLANLSGHDSHGVGMVPRYVDILLAGGLNLDQHVSIVRDAGSLLALDGNAGYGQVIGVEAMELGIARAGEHGVAVIGLAKIGRSHV